jgi:hypothetical protein
MAHRHYSRLSEKSSSAIPARRSGKEIAMRNVIVTLAGLVVAGSLAVSGAPAAAADARCAEMPQQIRSALAGAEPKAAQNAARRLRTGEALCRANNQRAAAKEFQVALKLLGASGAGTAAAGK